MSTSKLLISFPFFPLAASGPALAVGQYKFPLSLTEHVQNLESTYILMSSWSNSLQEKVPNVISLRSPSFLLIPMHV